MINDFSDAHPDVMEIRDVNEIPLLTDVPYHLDVLPDGQETLIIGDVEDCKDYNHLQGDNPYGFQGTCGLVSCEDILRQYGIDVTEADIVQYAIENGYCHVPLFTDLFLAEAGGTTNWDQATILTDYGVPAHVEFLTSPDRLSDLVEQGRSVIIEVNAGVLWDEPSAYGAGEANHAIVVTGVSKDPNTGEIQGFYINDSGRGYEEDSGRFIDIETMNIAWTAAGGEYGSSCVVTDLVRTFD